SAGWHGSCTTWPWEGKMPLFGLFRKASKTATQVCSSCRETVPATAVLCPECGGPLAPTVEVASKTPEVTAPVSQAPAAPVAVRCPSCGETVTTNAATCPACGSGLPART